MEGNSLALNTISLFSGICGLDLGHKLAFPNARTVAYVEQDTYCQTIIRSRVKDGWLDDAPIFADVRDFDGRPWRGVVDSIIGGFPCQDISVAGKRAGITGERSGLWKEFYRIVCETRPRYVFVENVRALVNRGMSVVLGDLADAGHDAEWLCLRASDVGAPHQRDRVFILAYAGCDSVGTIQYESVSGGEATDACTQGKAVSDTGNRQFSFTGRGSQKRDRVGPTSTEYVGNTHDSRLEGRRCEPISNPDERTAWSPSSPFWPPAPHQHEQWQRILEQWPELCPATEKTTQSYFRGMAHGYPFWVDPADVYRKGRLRALGNAVVPFQAAMAFSLLWQRMMER